MKLNPYSNNQIYLPTTLSTRDVSSAVLDRLKPCHQAIPLFPPSRVPFSVVNTKLRVKPYDEIGEVECNRRGEAYGWKH
jgi:hypothetical protein